MDRNEVTASLRVIFGFLSDPVAAVLMVAHILRDFAVPQLQMCFDCPMACAPRSESREQQLSRILSDLMQNHTDGYGDPVPDPIEPTVSNPVPAEDLPPVLTMAYSERRTVEADVDVWAGHDTPIDLVPADMLIDLPKNVPSIPAKEPIDVAVVLIAAGWPVRKAARHLGIAESTLRNRIKRKP